MHTSTLRRRVARAFGVERSPRTAPAPSTTDVDANAANATVADAKTADATVAGLRADGGDRRSDRRNDRRGDESRSVAAGDGGGERGEYSGSTGGYPATEVVVSRRDDGTVFEGGESNRVQLSVSASEPVLVRDRVPANWTVTAVDDAAVVEADGERFVEFAVVDDGSEHAYVAQASTDPAHTGRCEFGPAAYSVDGESWTDVGETSTAIVVDVRHPNHRK